MAHTRRNKALTVITVPFSPIKAANVSTVPQRSPLRYPGGKTWLIPHVRAWLSRSKTPPRLIEPFAGGGVTSLTAVMEGLVENAVMCELDADVAAFWRSALNHGPALRKAVLEFVPSARAVQDIIGTSPSTDLERGFRALVLNRMRRGGVLAEGASLLRKGENGKGLASRWYPETLAERIAAVERHAHLLSLQETDGVEFLASLNACEHRHVLFVDPPYTAGHRRPGQRLYVHSEVDHCRLFELVAGSPADFLMTYDNSPDVLKLSRDCGFHVVKVAMRTTSHVAAEELLITRRAVFSDRAS